PLPPATPPPPPAPPEAPPVPPVPLASEFLVATEPQAPAANANTTPKARQRSRYFRIDAAARRLRSNSTFRRGGVSICPRLRAGKDVEEDRAGGGDVERVGGRRHRDGHAVVAAAQRFRRQAGAF